MSDELHLLYQLIEKDPRYPIEAYFFVRDALHFASDSMELGTCQDGMIGEKPEPSDRHLTGQQLCEAIRKFSLNQFGFMSQVVLANWGIDRTGCFGDIVYNMIGVGLMKKSAQDRKSDFDDVFDFDEVFTENFEICCGSIAQRRS